MTTDISLEVRSREENWLPILELAVEEVFEIMLGCRVRPLSNVAVQSSAEFTAMVGLAGSLCGVLSVSCDRKTAGEVAKCMLGPEITDSSDQVSDALGEICNMIAGNFKNKLAGADSRCVLSVPTVIIGEEHCVRSLADGDSLQTVMCFQDSQVVTTLQLHS
jgi:chemotaxis protein CheX